MLELGDLLPTGRVKNSDSDKSFEDSSVIVTGKDTLEPHFRVFLNEVCKTMKVRSVSVFIPPFRDSGT